jgi:hypothetical protein
MKLKSSTGPKWRESEARCAVCLYCETVSDLQRQAMVIIHDFAQTTEGALATMIGSCAVAYGEDPTAVGGATGGDMGLLFHSAFRTALQLHIIDDSHFRCATFQATSLCN